MRIIIRIDDGFSAFIIRVPPEGMYTPAPFPLIPSGVILKFLKKSLLFCPPFGVGILSAL